jgi:hypothetical protein
VRWIDSLSDWDSALPAALIVRGVAPKRRRALLRELAARALGIEPTDVALEHRTQTAPMWLKPAGAGGFLSSASRLDWAVVAVAQLPIGVDVEAVDPEGEIPWNVLHPTEAGALRPLQTVNRARAFARLWSVKEAYVKALRIGIREADSFAVRLREDGTALIDDPLGPGRVAEVRTIWRSAGPAHAAVSAVVLDPPRTT